MKPSTSYLEHILVETEYLLKTSRPISLNAFLADETLQRAFVRSLEIIGEAVKNLPDDLKIRYPEPDWRRMAGTRDRLIMAISASISNWSGTSSRTRSHPCIPLSSVYSILKHPDQLKPGTHKGRPYQSKPLTRSSTSPSPTGHE